MALRPALITRGLSAASGPSDTGSPAEQRDDAKMNMLRAMRLPFTHVWNIYVDRPQKEQQKAADGTYQATLETLIQISSVQAFWQYNNNFPIENLKMRESVYLFKQGFVPVWEDRRNIKGGSYTFRVPKENGPDFWTRVQLMAIGEKLQDALDSTKTGDQICGVGLSVRFNAHLISIWHRDASDTKAEEALLKVVLDELPAELRPKDSNYFHKKHSDHAGFKAPATETKSIPVPTINAPTP
ncbi:hypothetical protein HYALB_00003510 [Hymenoscyphus albidus]|uniref:Uncharacterized protein n=1 Tax=Hymenoscyphus albidus TaxID=595503 RepID=A0A9N9LR42_9HELO|nr:hypothetical protein HYALB_00003510 [Hymenoscyphus albidus]